jgi:putative secretion ATPase (PEP-CTERM system associated)
VLLFSGTAHKDEEKTMYLEFDGLSESPFNLTPDANFLYPSRVHREVLAHLLYGINSRKGFIMVTGEVGSGKTTLCRAVLKKLGPNTDVALVLNSFLTEEELLKTINEDLGIPTAGKTKKELIDELNSFLLEERMKGRNVVVILDEAQNLSFPVLEQIRMLSNLETEKEKLLQIVLVGQPELRRLIASPRLRQLSQRITVRHHITSLSQTETSQYIYHRLKVAGATDNIVFTSGALKEVHRFSRGIPRMINVICDQALLAGYVAGSSRIDRKMIRAAETEMEGVGEQAGRSFAGGFSFARVAAWAGLVLAAGLIGSSIYVSVTGKPLLMRRTSKFAPEETGQAFASPAKSQGVRSGTGFQPVNHGQDAHATSDAVPRLAGQETTVPSRSEFAGETPALQAEKVPSLARLAFLAGATTRVGDTLPVPLGANVSPLFEEESEVLTALPPRPTVLASTHSMKIDSRQETGDRGTASSGVDRETPHPIPETPSTKSQGGVLGIGDRAGPPGDGVESSSAVKLKPPDRKVLAYRSLVEPLCALLRLWNKPPDVIEAVRKRYNEVGGHLPSLAGAAQMGWLSFRADVEKLRQVNMPVVVEIIGDSEERRGFVTLVSLADTWADLATADGNKRVDIRVFSKIYGGNAIIVCDDEGVDPAPYRQGQGLSLGVRRLQDALGKTGYLDSNPSGWFTPATAAAVMKFQRDHNLPASGEADGYTRLLLYAMREKQSAPRLAP